MVVRTGLQDADWRIMAMRLAPVIRIGARQAEIIAHGWTAGLKRTGQATGISSRRACQWAVLSRRAPPAGPRRTGPLG